MVSDEDITRGYLQGFLSARNIPEQADVIVLRNCKSETGVETLIKLDEFVDGLQTISNFLWQWVGDSFDFGRGRNIMQHLASTPWLLHMDADERVYEHERLIALCEALPPDCGAAYCTLVWHQTHGRGSGMAKHRGTYPILRLVRNDPRIYWSWQIHEQVLPSVIHGGMRTCDTRLCIVHEGYAVDKETMIGKHKRNIQGLMRQWVETPNEWLLQKLRHTVIEWHMTEAEDPDVLKQTIDTDEILPDGLEMRPRD
jgi:hypothetical protein